MTKAKELASTHTRYMEIYLIAAFLYILSKFTAIVDEKLRIPDFEPEKIQ